MHVENKPKKMAYHSKYQFQPLFLASSVRQTQLDMIFEGKEMQLL